MSPVLDTRPRILGMTRWPFAIVVGLAIGASVFGSVVALGFARHDGLEGSAADSVRDGDLERPSKPRVAGTVLRGGKPVSAAITVRRVGPFGVPAVGAPAATTNALDDGVFRIDAIAAGAWQAEARTKDRRTGFRTFSLGSGDSVDITVEVLEGPHTVVGRVAGSGEFHGVVVLLPPGGTRNRGELPPFDCGTASNWVAERRFAFASVPAGTYRLIAFHPRLETLLETEVVVPVDREVVIPTSKELGRRLHGRVVWHSGAPAEGARVDIETGAISLGVTDAAGEFDALYFGQGAGTVVISASNEVTLEGARLPLPQDGDALLDATLRPTVRGSVLAPTGVARALPVEIAVLSAARDRGTGISSTTGRSFFVPVDDGACRVRAVSASASGLFVATTTLAAPAEVSPRLERLPDDVLYVTVGGLGESGLWSGRILVHQEDEGGRRTSAPHTLDENSAATVPVRRGSTTVWIEHDAIRRRGDTRLWPRFVAGPLDVSKRWLSTSVPVDDLLDVTIVDRSRKPLADVVCRVDPTPWWHRDDDKPATTDASGAVRVLINERQLAYVVPPAPFAPEVFAGPGVRSGAVTLTLTEGVPRTIRVRGPDGKPVRSATVRLLWLPAGGPFVDHAEALGRKPFETDDDGVVTIPRTDPHRMYLLDVRPRGGYGLQRAFVESWRVDDKADDVVVLSR